MEYLRQYFLENDVMGLEEIAQNPETDQTELYHKLSGLYTECETRNVPLDQSVYEFVMKHIVEYRLTFAEKNEGIAEKPETDIPGRIELLIEILDKYSDYKFYNDDEKGHFLKFIARNLNAFTLSKEKVKNPTLQNFPWSELSFIICIFVATKTSSRLEKYPYLDNYFQLLVNEKLIWVGLRQLLATLKDVKEFNEEIWQNFNQVYQKTKYYYLLKKLWSTLDYLQRVEWEEFETKPKIIPRVLKHIEGYFQQLTSLTYPSIEDHIGLGEKEMRDSFVMICDTLSNYVEDNIGEFTEMDYVKIRTDLFQLQMIISTKILRERTIKGNSITKELKAITDLAELRNRVDEICISDTHPSDTIKYKENWFQEYVQDLINGSLEKVEENIEVISGKSKLVLELLKEVINSLNLNITSTHLFSFIHWFRHEECNPTLEEAKSKLVIPMPLVLYFEAFDEKLSEFANSLPAVKEKVTLLYFIKNVLHFTQPLSLVTNGKSDDEVIANILTKIETAIVDETVKSKFQQTAEELQTKRALLEEYKKYKNFDVIAEKWPVGKSKLTLKQIKNYVDPLEILLNKNQSIYTTVDEFLLKISIKVRSQIIAQLKEDEQSHLKNNLEEKIKEFKNFDDTLLTEMHFLECFEQVKLLGIDIVKDNNFLDFNCPIPTTQNLKSFISAGDIYLDLFSKNSIPIIQAHIEVISKSLNNIKRLGFNCSDDLTLMKKNFYKQRSWILESSDLFKWNFRSTRAVQKYISDFIPFKVRDHKDLTIIHYILRNLDKTNPFLMYIVKKLSDSEEYEENPLFERILEDTKSFNYKPPSHIDISQEESVNIFIDKFINASDPISQRFLLCHILCFDCPDLKVMKQLFFDKPQDLKMSDGLLQIASAQGLKNVVQFLLSKKDFHLKNIDEKYYGYNALSYAAISDNLEMVSLLLENEASLVDMNENLRDESPLSVAAKFGNVEVVTNFLESDQEVELQDIYKALDLYIESNEEPDLVQTIVDEYPDVLLMKSESLLNNCDSILCKACFCGRKEIVKVLIEKGKTLPDWSKSNSSKILSAACVGFNDPEIIQYLIDNGMPVNCEEVEFSPLNVAYSYCSIDIVRLLLKNGANPSQQLSNCKSAISWAITNKSMDKITLLFEAGVSVFTKDIFYEIACAKSEIFELFLARKPSKSWALQILPEVLVHGTTKVLKMVLDYITPDKVKVEIARITTAICLDKVKNLEALFNYPHYECEGDDLSEILRLGIVSNKIEIAKSALKMGANINHQYPASRYGTLLHIACQEETIDARKISFLLENGADVNIKTEFNDSVLDVVIRKAQGRVTDIMRLLSEQNAVNTFEFNFFEFQAQDRLLFGVCFNSFDQIKGALDRGADINFNYKKFRKGTVLHVSCNFSFETDPSIVEFLINNGIDLEATDDNDCTALELAYFNNKTEIYNLLLGQSEMKQPEMEITQEKYDRLLLYGVICDNLEKVEKALGLGANINIVLKESYNLTPLHIACLKSSADIVQHLLINGANKSAKNCSNLTPVEIAVYYDREVIVDWILKRWPDIKKHQLVRLLKIAVLRRSLKVVRVLIERGADVNHVYKEFNNNTLLAYAHRNADNQLIKLLLKYGAQTVGESNSQEGRVITKKIVTWRKFL